MTLQTRPGCPTDSAAQVTGHDQAGIRPADPGQGRPRGPAAAAGVAPLPLAHRLCDLHRPVLRAPGHPDQSPVTLNYTQFLSDVSAHKVKTVTIEHERHRDGHAAQRQHLHHGDPATGRPGLAQRAAANKRPDHRARRRAPPSAPRCCPGSSCSALPLFGYFWWRLSKRAGGRPAGGAGRGALQGQGL